MREFVYGKPFSTFIIAVILINAASIGVETYIHHPLLTMVDNICLWIFVVEIVLKMRYAFSWREYWRDPWNLFDVAIVSAAFLPAAGHMATVLRIVRVFRVLRLVNLVPELKLIVSVLMRSLVSMTYIALLMSVTFYIYAVIGVKLFGDRQPEYATLHEALFSLFRILTLEDWTDIRYEGIDDHGYNYWLVTLYHVSWVMLSTFVMINLIVGAIINNYHEVQELEKRRRSGNGESPDDRIRELMAELNRLLEERLDGNVQEVRSGTNGMG